MMSIIRPSTPLRWFVDLLLVAIVVAVYWILEYLVEPYHRGFFCDDDTIHYPMVPESISFPAILSIGGFSTLAAILAAHLYVYYTRNASSKTTNFRIVIEDILTYIFGVFSAYCTCNVMKLMVGRLRPYFMAACFKHPDDLLAYCPTGNEHYYVTDFICTETGYDMSNARMSFPSGHSSTITFSMVFISLYLWRRIGYDTKIKFFLPLIQVCAIDLAVYVIMTRVAEYKHHWEDVLMGSVNGLCFAVVTVLYLIEEVPEDESKQPLLVHNCHSYSYQSTESIK